MLISSREKVIIKYLLKRLDFITIRSLAEKLKVTERTIYREIPGVTRFLQSCGVKLETVQGNGLRLQGDKASLTKLEERLGDRQLAQNFSAQERVDLTMMELIRQTDYIKTQALAIELTSSIQTSRNDLKQIEETIQNSNLKLMVKKGEGVYLSGCVVLKHHLLAGILSRNIDVDLFFSWLAGAGEKQIFIDRMEYYGYEALLKGCYRLLKGITEHKDIHITDTNFQELVILTALLVKRIQSGEGKYDDFSMERSENNGYVAFVQNITNDFEQYFQISFSLAEKKYLQWLVYLSISQDMHNTLYKRDFILAPQVRKFIVLVEEQMGIYLREDLTLFKGLLVHLDKALTRIRSGMSVSNPIHQEIKDKYGELYRVIWECAAHIFPGDTFPEDEIGYLVLYFAVSLDKISKKSFRVLVVCSSGMGSSKMLASRLEREIPEIYIKKLVALINLPEEELGEYDLILSTIPLSLASNRYMMVSPLLNEKELEKVKEAIRRHKHKNLKMLDKNRIGNKAAKAGNEIAGLKKMRLVLEWSIFLLERFHVFSVASKDLKEGLVAFLSEDLCQRGVVASSQDLQNMVEKNETDAYWMIPNTKLCYLECGLKEVVKPSLLVYHFEQEEVILDFMSAQSVIVLLYPARKSELLRAFLGNIIMWMIEETDTIHLFEKGEEARLTRLLGERVRQYITDHF